ncbi:MAG: chorismate-binding protein, partial [Pirellulales bacterium]
MTLVERLEPAPDPVEVFRRLAHLPHVVFFDSAVRGGPTGRYSFVAADPIRWWDSPDALAEAAEVASQLSGHARPELPPFQGGLAGMFGYELAPQFERVPVAKIDEFALPPLGVGWYDVVLAFDHEQNAAWLISQGGPKTDPAARLTQFRKFLLGEVAAATGDTVQASPALPRSALAPQYPVGIENLTSNISAADYHHAVRRAIDYIHAGDVFQVNLAQRLLHPAHDSPVELYCRLRERNPAPMAGYLDGGGWQVASASPERFLKVVDKHVETRPIKGTAARTRETEADRASGQRLAASAKDRAENVMIVDLLRNDLSRVCRPES